MSKDSRLRMPSSQGGLTSYYDLELKSKIQLKPETVVAICIVLGALVLSLGYILGA